MIKKLKLKLKSIFFLLQSIKTNFTDDKCQLHAAALTFITLLTLIPFLALIFSIAKGLGIQNYIEQIIIEKLALGKQEILLNILAYIENTKLTTLGTTGVFFLLFTVIRLLGSIETVFNTIWSVKTPRRITRKISDYLTIVILCPIFIFITFTINAGSSSNVLIQKLLQISFLNNAYLFFIKMLPFITLWVALSIFYMFMPNTKIRLSAGLIAGIISGTIWQVFNWAYLKFQIGITRYNAIYGTFATVPIFMVWLYTSWIVILLGAELGFVFQNRKKLRKAPNAENPSLLELEELLITLKFIVKRFQEGKFPLKYEDITTHSDLAKENLSRVIEYLKKRKILTQKEEEIYFLKNPAQVKLSEIILPSHYQENDKILQIIDKITNKEALDSCAITDLI